MFLNQCSQSLGEYTFSSNAESFAGLQVLRMEKSVNIPSLTMVLMMSLISVDWERGAEQQHAGLYRGNSLS